MRRVLGLALALTLAASTAFAQSDSRRLAVFVEDGDPVNLVTRTSGNPVGATGNATSETFQEAITALDRMGVPYQFFDLGDTANWWKVLGEAGPLSTNNPGIADSIRFRQAGFFGCLMVCLSTDNNYQHFKRFQSKDRRTYLSSPLGGLWGIPTLCLNDGMENSAGYPFNDGGAYISVGVTSPTGVSYIRHGFKKSTTDFGDTLDLARALRWQVATGQKDSVDVLIRSDSLSLTGANGGEMVAWKWKNSTYYYPSSSAGNSIFTLLGLNTLFKAAGYYPRRMLNLHWTLDHPYPETITATAPSDSAWRYINYAGWRFSGAMKSSTTERTNQQSAMATFWRTRMRALAIPCYPHSHLTGVGEYFNGAVWNHVTFADSSNMRQKWNWMEAAITDTMGLSPARGYERTIGFPGDGVYFPDLYIFAQNGYTDIRSTASDSLGAVSGNAFRRVFSGPATTSSTFPKQPWPFIEPTSGKVLWVHDAFSYPGDSVTVWSSMGSNFSNDIDGKMDASVKTLAKAILNDADTYWHPNYNLQNSGIERPMQVMLRRWLYILNRLDRIVTVQPSYLNKTPRRTSIARG